MSTTIEKIPLSRVTPRILSELAKIPEAEGVLDRNQGVFYLKTEKDGILPEFHLLGIL